MQAPKLSSSQQCLHWPVQRQQQQPTLLQGHPSRLVTVRATRHTYTAREGDNYIREQQHASLVQSMPATG